MVGQQELSLAKNNLLTNDYDRQARELLGIKSVIKVQIVLLSNFSFIKAIKETRRRGREDRQGIDLKVILHQDVAALLGFDEIRIQVKSSEYWIEEFIEKGKQINANWLKLKLVILNGQQTDNFIIADFITQVLFLLDAKKVSKEDKSKFMECIDSDVFEVYKTLSILHSLNEVRNPVWLLLNQ